MSITGPTPAGFLAFIRNVMRIDPLVLPDDDPVINVAYDMAISIVDQSLAAVPNIYPLAVYNLGGDGVINFAQDQTDRDFFEQLRKKLDIETFSAGVISSSSNSATAQSTLNPEFMKTLMLSDLQHLKTPWGRQYLQFAQRIGTLWGMS